VRSCYPLHDVHIGQIIMSCVLTVLQLEYMLLIMKIQVRLVSIIRSTHRCGNDMRRKKKKSVRWLFQSSSCPVGRAVLLNVQGVHKLAEDLKGV
jgi:hypothetical protein